MESLTVMDGLSQGFILSLFEDSRGFIWTGTFNGLNRYDGYQIKRFTTDKSAPGALKANYIYCISEDEYGLLWLGTDKGLVVMDPYTEQFVQLIDIVPTLPKYDVIHINLKKACIWASTRIVQGNGKIVGSIYTICSMPDLIHRIRENNLTADAFQVAAIDIPPGTQGPFKWLKGRSDDEILAVDAFGKFCRTHSADSPMEQVDLRTLDYQRVGKYGLTHYSKETGFVFQIPETSDQPVQYLADFMRLPDGTPLIYLNNDTLLYLLDSIADTSKPPLRGITVFNQHLRPFFQLDRQVSHAGMVDRNGTLWVGTNGHGVRKLSPRKLTFKQLLPSSSFYNFAFLPDGRIWPGRDFPIKVFDPNTGVLARAPWATMHEKGDRVFNLLITRSGDWWIPMSKNGRLFILIKERLSHVWQSVPIELDFSSYGAVQLLEDCHSNIWISGKKGQLARIRQTDLHIDYWQFGQYFPHPEKESLASSCLVEDRQGILWLGCSRGLVRIANTDGEAQLQVWHNESEKGILFKNDYILSICPDLNDPNLIWIGTYGGGLHCFDSRKGRSEFFSEKEGLIDNMVYGILPDAFGYLWLSTNRGLSRFNRQNRTFYNFIDEDEKLKTEFNTDSYRMLPSGELAFGSVNGLFLIQPLLQDTSSQAATVAITELKINGKVFQTDEKRTFLSVNAQNEVSLKIPFEKNNITFEFAALQTSDPASAQFRYRMLGLDDHWIYAGLQRSANFALIPPGKYTLELQSITGNGNWADAPVTKVFVTIIPPWYRSTFAWILYTLLFLLLISAYVRYERRHVQLKYTEEINGKEIERLKSLDDFKNRFFGYISHEFKTPLTIILGQAKRLAAEKNPADIDLKAGAIFQQGQSMLEMVTQMVDVTKLDKQEIQLNWRNGNISTYVRTLVESLRSLADFKNVQLHFHSAAPGLMMDFDPLRMKFIVNNLLSNAITHTDSGGTIYVSIRTQEQERMLLEVKDSGQGIAPENLSRIFDRYYQVSKQDAERQEPHFGLGLTFVKDLMDIFGGEISVSSELGKGATFVVSLPVLKQAAALDTLPPSGPLFHLPENSAGSLSKKTLPLLLIVEDNPFIFNFLQYTLDPHFRLEFAKDGAVGYEKALKIVPDLILTDVMMPEMDGYELTQRLKSHELTGHIPIVMLSARSGLSDRLAGQKYGADAYIGKPFDEQELIMVLKNLHQLQHRWRERYSHIAQSGFIDETSAPLPEQAVETVKQTDAFMLKMYGIFEKNYVDDTYDLPQLCRDIEMSKSQLQRKLVALSDLSAMELLRRYRLQKAYELLSGPLDYTVKEVCFLVGFKDAAHFSRLFSKTYDSVPSDVKKKGL